MRKKYATLEEVRADKVKAKRQIISGVDRFRYDLSEYIMPSDSMFLNSTKRYMNYVGYAIALYRGFITFRGAFRFLAKLF